VSAKYVATTANWRGDTINIKRGDLTTQVNEINPPKTAMIVVNMQNDFVAVGAAMETPAARAMVPKLAEALRICREAGTRVIYTAQCTPS
jgi:isochorismate hydrolase